MVIISASYFMNKINLSATAGAAAGSQISGRNKVDMYGKFDAGLSVRFNPDKVFFMTLSASGQWIPFNDVVPNQEVMYAGGASSVRGYSEGVLWGKSGYTVSGEFHIWLPGSTRSSAFVFADHAGIVPYPADVRDKFLLGAGAGLDVYLGNIVHFNLSLGVPVIKTDQGAGQSDFKCNFSLTLSSPSPVRQEP